MKKIFCLPLLIVSLGLTGCSNFLYSNKAAPVYSGNRVALDQYETARKNAKMRQGVVTSTAIEKPQGTAMTEKAIENLRNTRIAVENSQNSPYVKLPNSVARPVGTTNSDLKNKAKGEVSETNRIIEEADKEVAEAYNQKTSTVVARPAEVMKQKTQQVNGKVEASVDKVEASVDKAAETVTKTKPATPKSATKSLLQEARSAVAAGNYDKAASALERAHRIEPGNAKILYDIAQIRYAQGNYVQAQSFASRAANYSSNAALSKKIWTILAKSRKALGNASGAAAAAQKAASF